jgi:CD109 antigen
VTPGFFEEHLNTDNVLLRPYGAGEMNMFNFAYNLYTLKFKKSFQQLDDHSLKIALQDMNIALQRQLGYMNRADNTPYNSNSTGSFRMFRDDPTPSLWLTAFVGKTLQEARIGEWERDLFIPVELLNTIVLWMCHQQNDTGAFYPSDAPVYDRIFVSTFTLHNGFFGIRI